MNRTLPKGLFKRGGTYAVRFSVPKELQTVVGKREIIRSLGTADFGEALMLKDVKLSEIREGLFARADGSDVQRKPKVKSQATTIRATANRWLNESDGIKNATRQRYRYIMQRFEKFTGNAHVSEIERATALAYIEHLRTHRSERTGEPLSHRSLFTHQICLASYWRVLDHWGLVDPDMRNPFSSLLRRIAGQKRTADPRSKNLRPVTREEAERFLGYIAKSTRLKYQFEMYVTVRLLWVTGCRLGEICGRRLGDIDDRGDHIRINIPESKTEAGKRLVVIVGQNDCDLLRHAVARAKVTAPICPENAGQLFPRIRLGGYDMQPSHYLGKALEHARKTLGDDHFTWDMHSFRRSAVATLVNAGVAKEARNLAVGHANADDIGISVYAKEADLFDIIRATFETLYSELGGSLKTPLDL